MRLRASAHMLGFAGHFHTKSRRYSTTMGALHAARRPNRTRLQETRRTLLGREDLVLTDPDTASEEPPSSSPPGTTSATAGKPPPTPPSPPWPPTPHANANANANANATARHLIPVRVITSRGVAVTDTLLTVAEVLEELRVPRSTWYLWRQLGKTPRVYKLPNGELRIRRSVLEQWLATLESEAA